MSRQEENEVTIMQVNNVNKVMVYTYGTDIIILSKPKDSETMVRDITITGDGIKIRIV